jgi:hypothetical protein
MPLLQPYLNQKKSHYEGRFGAKDQGIDWAPLRQSKIGNDINPDTSFNGVPHRAYTQAIIVKKLKEITPKQPNAMMKFAKLRSSTADRDLPNMPVDTLVDRHHPSRSRVATYGEQTKRYEQEKTRQFLREEILKNKLKDNGLRGGPRLRDIDDYRRELYHSDLIFPQHPEYEMPEEGLPNQVLRMRHQEELNRARYDDESRMLQSEYNDDNVEHELAQPFTSIYENGNNNTGYQYTTPRYITGIDYPDSMVQNFPNSFWANLGAEAGPDFDLSEITGVLPQQQQLNPYQRTGQGFGKCRNCLGGNMCGCGCCNAKRGGLKAHMLRLRRAGH